MSDSFATPSTVAHQVPLFMGFSRQEYWRGLPSPSPYIYVYTHTHTHIYIQCSLMPITWLDSYEIWTELFYGGKKKRSDLVLLSLLHPSSLRTGAISLKKQTSSPSLDWEPLLCTPQCCTFPSYDHSTEHFASFSRHKSLMGASTLALFLNHNVHMNQARFTLEIWEMFTELMKRPI